MCNAHKIFFVLFSALCLPFMAMADAQDEYLSKIDSAEVYIGKAQWDRAEVFIKEALQVNPADPNNSLLLSNLATVQRYQNKLAEALGNYTKALAITPHAVTLLSNRANLYMDMDSIDAACRDYEAIISLDHNDLESRYYHGMIAIDRGNMDVAKKDFDEIVKISPKSPLGIEGMAMWNKASGNYQEAALLYNQLIDKDKNVTYLSNRAECYLKLKRLNDASDDIREALEMAPDDAFLYILRARLSKARFVESDKKRDIALAIKYGMSKRMAEQLANQE